MSIPRNHHYVSQVLSKKFMSPDGKIFKFNKKVETRRFETKTSTRNLFSERNLNSKRDFDGNIDHSSVEMLLNQNFENDFNSHYDIVIEATNADVDEGSPLPNSEEVMESLEYLVGMGLIDQARHPKRIKESNRAIWGTLLKIAEHATEELKTQIYTSYNGFTGITNKTPIDFRLLKDEFLELMGDVTLSINIAHDGEFFLLPNCTAAIIRVKLPDDIIDGKVYINPSEPIASVLMPLNSRVLITITSDRIIPDKPSIYGHGIYQLERHLTREFNKRIIERSIEEVIYENEKYLKSIVEEIENDNK